MDNNKKAARRKVGVPLNTAERPKCYGKEYLKYPEVCGLVCVFGFSGDNSCDRESLTGF